MDILTLIAATVASLIIAGLITSTIILAFKSRKYYNESVQLSMDKVILLVQLEKLTETRDVKNVEESQGFVKFLSESRDWAFTFIDDVQAAIEEYRKIADVIPLSKDMTVEQAENLSAAYDKLVSFLPEDNLL